jgi:peptidyl-prolyl cis-trans isomerase NIMA-interacting 1
MDVGSPGPMSRRPRPSLLAVCLLGAVSACSVLTSPPEREVEPKPRPVAEPAPSARPAPTLIPVQLPPSKDDEKVAASHILVAYKGARNAAASVTRSKDQGKKRAEEALKKAKAGGDFAALAQKYSDDPGSGPRGGDLGSFTRKQMVPPFSEAAFSLKPGEVSAIVETDFGFHVIKRSQ